MTTLDSLADGYNMARFKGDSDMKNLHGNMLIMFLLRNPKQILELDDTRNLGLTLAYIICFQKDGIADSTIKSCLTISFWSLYKSLKLNPTDYEIKASINMIFLEYQNPIFIIYKNSLVNKHDASTSLEKANLFKAKISRGVLDEYPGYHDSCEIIFQEIESLFINKL